MSRRTPPPAGLCAACAHQQLVPNTRGSVFSLCGRSRTDPSYPKYPPIPVRTCPGFVPRDQPTGDPARGREANG